MEKDYQNLDAYLDQLENESVLDIPNYLEHGDAYYTLGELKQLFQQWRNQYQMYQRLIQLFIFISAASVIWIIVGALFYLGNIEEGFLVSMILFPFFLVFGLIGCLFLYFKFGTLSHQQDIGLSLKTSILKKLDELGSQRNKNWPRDIY